MLFDMQVWTLYIVNIKNCLYGKFYFICLSIIAAKVEV